MEPIAKFTDSLLTLLRHSPFLIKTVIALRTDESAKNGIIFQNVLTLVADVQKWQVLYQNDYLYQG